LPEHLACVCRAFRTEKGADGTGSRRGKPKLRRDRDANPVPERKIGDAVMQVQARSPRRRNKPGIQHAIPGASANRNPEGRRTSDISRIEELEEAVGEEAVELTPILVIQESRNDFDPIAQPFNDLRRRRLPAALGHFDAHGLSQSLHTKLLEERPHVGSIAVFQRNEGNACLLSKQLLQLRIICKNDNATSLRRATPLAVLTEQQRQALEFVTNCCSRRRIASRVERTR
jgi:hypothetical protein